MSTEILNEEKYQKTKGKISIIALIILIIGICCGGFLIFKGTNNNTNKLDSVKEKLVTKRKELENKGIKYNTFAKYTDGEEYELKIITNALDPSFNHCAFDEYKSNDITKEYCSIKNSKSDFSRSGNTMLGIFVIIATCMISGFVYMIAKRREITAFGVQQMMPLAQEGMEKMAPTIGKVGKEITNEMAPAYGKIASEISKGIKEGLKDDKSSK